MMFIKVSSQSYHVFLKKTSNLAGIIIVFPTPLPPPASIFTYISITFSLLPSPPLTPHTPPHPPTYLTNKIDFCITKQLSCKVLIDGVNCTIREYGDHPGDVSKHPNDSAEYLYRTSWGN